MDAKKRIKKQRRKEALFLKKEAGLNVEFLNSSSCTVLVSNGGLENGLSRGVLELLLQTPHIHLLPGKDFSFASYSSPCSAREVVDAVNGVCVQSVPAVAGLLPPCLVSGPPLHLFLSYVSGLPSWLPADHSPCPLPPLPPGLVLINDFITEDEERDLILFLDSTFSGQATLKHRQVLHYGYQFNYDTNNVDPSSPLPGGFPPLIQQYIDRVMGCGHVHHQLDQVTVNRYPPGAGIPPHVDTHSAFLEEIVSLSLGSQVVMDFRKFCDMVEGGVADEKVPVVLPARSLLIMTGASRYQWTHGIATRHYDQLPSPKGFTTVPRETRFSLTLRAVRQPPCICQCEFPLCCDSRQDEPVPVEFPLSRQDDGIHSPVAKHNSHLTP